MSQSSSDSSDESKDSETDLLRLYKVQPHNHVVTRQDLNRDYHNESHSTVTHAEPIINNYYTWNSSRTNATIHKERAAIISALHSVQSSSSYPPQASSSMLQSSPKPSKSFTRSHRVRDIVHMCSEERYSYSADNYHHHHHNHHNDHVVPVETECQTHNDYANITMDNDRWPHVENNSRCWSCTATNGSVDGLQNDDINNNCRSPKSPQSSMWKWSLLGRLFKRKRDKR